MRSSWGMCLMVGLGLALSGGGRVWAQADGKGGLEELKSEVKELKAQNAQMMKMIEELQKRLEVGAKAAATPAPAAPAASGGGAAAQSAAPAAPAPGKAPDDKSFLMGVVPTVWTLGNSKLKFYGFLRLDVIHDDSSLNNNLLPFTVRSEDPLAARGIRAEENRSTFTADARLTRLGLDLEGGEMALLGGGKVTGKLELDFDSGVNSESRAVPRIRHAYLKTTWGDFSVLAGQTWDVLSPLYPMVNDHTLMWNAGNLGDRRPQFRVSYEPELGPGKLTIRTMAGLSGAIDNRDTEGSGNLDGAESALPIWETRVGYSLPLWVEKQNLDIGFWGHTSWEETDTNVSGEDRWMSYSYGMDLSVPLLKDLWWKTELWYGQDLTDVRGGIGQSINTRGEEINARGGWTELSYKPCDWLLAGAGYTLDKPNNDDIDVGGKTENTSLYLASTWYPGANVSVKVNFIHWLTQYRALKDGDDNRLEMVFQYNW